MKTLGLLVLVNLALVSGCMKHAPVTTATSVSPNGIVTKATPVKLPSNDSPNGLYDFYFAQGELIDLENIAAVENHSYVHTFVSVKGKQEEYTQCVPQGQPTRGPRSYLIVARELKASCNPR